MGLTSSTAIVVLTLLLLKQEGRVLHDVGVRVGVPSVGNFVVGIAIGFAVYGLVILSISAIVGPIRFTRVIAPHEGAIVLMLGSTLALSVMASKAPVFIRFAVRRRDRDSGVEAGALQAAYALRDDPDVAISDREALGELLRWLEQHLETPERFNRTRSKGYYRRQTRGIAWFKDSASEHLAQMYALKVLLERYGHFVDVLQESHIGYVVWEDAHQVIAEPFKDTRTS